VVRETVLTTGNAFAGEPFALGDTVQRGAPAPSIPG
jgi:hypothetical protein